MMMSKQPLIHIQKFSYEICSIKLNQTADQLFENRNEVSYNVSVVDRQREAKVTCVNNGESEWQHIYIYVCICFYVYVQALNISIQDIQTHMIAYTQLFIQCMQN